MMDEKKEQLEKVRRAFRDPYLRGWIPNYLLTILEQGEDAEDILSKMEQVMPKYCVPRKFETEEQQSLDEGSERQNDWRSLLFELSPTVRTFWAEKYNHYINPNGKYQTLLGFTDMRERFLQASHESSTELLYRIGWKPADTMCAYLLSMTTNRMYSLSPDAVREAVRLDGETAVRLLDKKVLGEMIVHHHSSYQAWWQKIWMEFLYLFCEFDDPTFLHAEHKTKKLKQQCQVIRERLANPDYEQLELEKELRACALLPTQEEPDDVSDKKFIKRQKSALLRAFVCSYLWRCSDWKKMKEHPAGRAMSRNLLWGYYRDGELQTVFALREDGSVLDEKGETVPPESISDETGKIGLVHPEELAETERIRWKKYAGKEKWKQPFPQLKMPVCQGQHDFSALSGVQVTELFLITAAGKWGLYQGSDRNRYISYHMADLLHGYGAQMVFDGIWRGPEYGPEIITAERVVFYRFRHFLLWEHVPESLVCAPEELPARFVSTAMAAFQGIIGKGKKKE